MKYVDDNKTYNGITGKMSPQKNNFVRLRPPETDVFQQSQIGLRKSVVNQAVRDGLIANKFDLKGSTPVKFTVELRRNDRDQSEYYTVCKLVEVGERIIHS